MELEQRAVIFFLTKKGFKLTQIQNELTSVYNKEAFNVYKIKYWIHQYKIGRKSIHDEPKSGRPPIDYIDTKIISALADEPYHSTNTLSEFLGIPKSTIKDHLKILGYKNYNLKIVPYNLTCEMKLSRVTETKKLL